MFGWGYFLAWSFAIYPQAYTNYVRKSVQGFSVDYGTVNFLGFLFYLIYTCGGYIYPPVGTDEVSLQDVFYSAHAYMSTTFVCVQVIIYDRGGQSISLPIKAIFVFFPIIFIVTFFLQISGHLDN